MKVYTLNNEINSNLEKSFNDMKNIVQSMTNLDNPFSLSKELNAEYQKLYEKFNNRHQERKKMLFRRRNSVSTNGSIFPNFPPFGADKTPDINILKVSEISIMDRYSTGSTISKHDIIDAFKIVELVDKNSLNTNDNNNDTPSEEEKEEIKPIKIEDSNDITEQILYEAKPEEEKVEVKKEEKSKKKETNKVSLKEIDDRLMTIDDFLGDF